MTNHTESWNYYDWQLTLWDAKDRVMSIELGNDIGALIDHANAMIDEQSAADYEVICLFI